MNCAKPLLLAIACSLSINSALACGPNFPYRLLGDRAETLASPPEGSFAFEINTLGARINGLADTRTATLWWSDADEREQARQAAEHEQLDADSAQLIQQLRQLKDAAEVLRAGAELPAQLRLYTAGAVAFKHGDYAQAAELFNQVLQLPEHQRQLRSTWASYSLGRALLAQSQNAPTEQVQALRQQALAAFEQTLLQSSHGTSDPLELGIASLGEQARIALQNQDWARAIALYASQALHGSETGSNSLRQLALQLNRMDDAQLQPLLAISEVQRLLVAQEFSRIDNHLLESSAGRRLLDSGVRIEPDIADRLAAITYRQGDYATTAKLLEHASTSGLSWWLRAKLALQQGDQHAASMAYAQAAKAFPAEQNWGLQQREYGDYEMLKPRCRVEGEMAILALHRGDYLDAFEQLFRSDDIYWLDAAEVAERVLSVEQLKAFVDRYVSTPTISAEQLNNHWQWPSAARLRELLGRRLLRQGQFSGAASYFITPERQALAQRYIDQQTQADNAWTDIGRAQALYAAAHIAREHGMELLGYELAPDEAWLSGAYGSEQHSPIAPSSWLSQQEANRQNASAAEPNRRFHYRWQAAELANQAADLLPQRSQAFAAVLCNASGWLNYRDLPGAQRIYRRYVAQGPYVPWAEHFGFNCAQPDFASARKLDWQQRLSTLKQTAHSYQHALFGAALALCITALWCWRKRKNALS